MLWSIAGVLGVSAIITLIYQLTVPEYAGKVPYWPYIRWQLIAYSFWVAGVPAVIAFARRTVAVAWSPLRMALTHLGACVAIVGAHVAWIEAALILFRIEVQFFYLHWITVPDVALYGALSLGIARARDAGILAESERVFRSIFENAVVGIFRSTPDGRFLMLNQSAAEAIGYPNPDEALREIDDIGAQIYADPADRERYLEAIMSEGKVKNWLWKMRRRDGSIMWNSENSRGVFDDRGRLLFIEGTAKDVTSEVVARDELRESERRSAELRVMLANAKLQALRLQIKPHFLFNVLNTIAMLIRNGEMAKAQHTVALLGEMFRQFLHFEDSDTLPLEQELSFVDLYLGLEQMRFEDRLVLDRHVDPETLGLRVPVLILQPIVENAVKYGVASVSGQCHIGLTARRTADRLRIDVTNSAGAPESQKRGHGIGLRNIQARLHEHYGGAGVLTFARSDGTAQTTIEIPVGED